MLSELSYGEICIEVVGWRDRRRSRALIGWPQSYDVISSWTRDGHSLQGYVCNVISSRISASYLVLNSDRDTGRDDEIWKFGHSALWYVLIKPSYWVQSHDRFKLVVSIYYKCQHLLFSSQQSCVSRSQNPTGKDALGQREAPLRIRMNYVTRSMPESLPHRRSVASLTRKHVMDKRMISTFCTELPLCGKMKMN